MYQFNWPPGFCAYLGESCKACNQRTLWVGRWPAVTLRPHLIFHASTVCVFSANAWKKSVLDTAVSDHFSLRSKVGALVLREVIFFFHIYPKSPGVLYGWSLKVGEMASRCTLMGISVAEICGIEMTSADSYSLLSSPPCRASTEAICLGDTNTHRYSVDTVCTLPAAASSLLICPSAPLLCFYTRGD